MVHLQLKVRSPGLGLYRRDSLITYLRFTAFLFCSLLGGNLNLSAQSLSIDLKTESLPNFYFTNSAFEIIKVSDERIINRGTRKLGEIVYSFGDTMKLKLRDSLEKSLIEFFSEVNKSPEYAVPVEAQIYELRLHEKPNFTDEYALARVKVGFTPIYNSKLSEEFIFESIIDTNGRQVSFTHEERLSRALAFCLFQLSCALEADTNFCSKVDDLKDRADTSGQLIQRVKSLNPHYLYRKRRYYQINELKSTLLSLESDKLNFHYRHYERNFKISKPLAFIGISLLGYSIVEFATKAYFNSYTLGAGVSLSFGSLYFQWRSQKNAKKCVEIFNEAATNK